MTTFLLIRHAATDAVGRSLAGRSPGHHLNDTGRKQVRRLVDLLDQYPIERVYSSPLERALETARPIAERSNTTPIVADELNELDYGDWTGRPFEELADDPHWHRFNRNRAGTRVPNGESMLDAQSRAVQFLLRLATESSDASIAIVSHCDLIRAVLLHHLDMSLDLVHRLEISPASLSILRVHDHGSQILLLNATTDALGQKS